MSKKKAVKCLETNQVFKSITEAARITGISLYTISDVCHGRRLGSYNNLHFEFIKESDSNE